MSYDDFGTPTAFANFGPGSPQYVANNDGVFPEFELEAILDEAATEEKGTPVFRDLEIVRIRIAGDVLSVATSIVDSGVKKRFPREYARWKEGITSRQIEGTPITEWPPLSRAQARMFEGGNIFTVEALAVVSDANIERIPDGRTWRQKAIAWLAAAKDGAAASRYAAENERLRDQIAALQKQFDEFAEQATRPDGDAAQREHWKTKAKREREEAESAGRAA